MRHNMLWLYFAPTSFTRVYLSEDLSSVTMAKMLFDVLSNAKYEVMAVDGLNLISSSKLYEPRKILLIVVADADRPFHFTSTSLMSCVTAVTCCPSLSKIDVP